MTEIEAEDWIVDRGHDVLTKQSEAGSEALTPYERMVLHLWYVDYCMRNAGDLANLEELCEDCLNQAARVAQTLNLPRTVALFAKDREAIEQNYLTDIGAIVTELAQID
ncbi:hypothetical protein [Qipengyuania sp. DGS5-3]|uniref:hypothetical protein n=1 Tax=Qipengyuania sp. DGS5-3 TaxID=3349632 RepID=UPI0036D30D40